MSESWLLCDYGGVICEPQNERDRAAIAALSGIEEAALWQSYDRYRLDYDLANLSSREFWSAVIGGPPSTTQLRVLVEADSASWSHIRNDTLDRLEAVRSRGLRLALLSNAPREIERIIRQSEWSHLFERFFFSCALRLAKPDPRIYEVVAKDLSARFNELVFVDDREDNLKAAAHLGIHSVRFSTPAVFDDL